MTAATVRRHLVFWPRAIAGSAGLFIAVIWAWVLIARRIPIAAKRQSFYRAMSFLCLRPAGIRLRVVAGDRVPANAPCIFACNHQSQLDYPIIGRIIPGNCLMVASQLGHWPVFGWMYRYSRSIEVDKHVPHRAVAALQKAEEAVRVGGHSVWFFVEGTRGKERGVMGRFRRGAFRLAVHTGVPVIPVVVSPLKPLTDLRGRRLARNNVVLEVLSPERVDPSALDPERELMERVRSRMEAALTRLA